MQETSSLDGSTWMPELRSLHRLTWPPEPICLEVDLAAEDKSRWVD